MSLEREAKNALNHSFCQSEFLTSDMFAKYLQDRELLSDGLLFGEDELEFLDQEGLVRPLFRLNLTRNERGEIPGLLISSESLRRYLQARMIEFPVPGDYRPWKTFGEGLNRSVVFFYHPFQAYMMSRVWSFIRPRLDYRILKPRFGIVSRKVVRSLYDWCVSHRDHYLSSGLGRDKELIAFLISLEAPYAPYVREHMRLGLIDRFDVEDWVRWRKNEFKPEDLLSKVNLTREQVVLWRDNLGSQAKFFDPLERWYLLLRVVSHGKKQQLKGKALLAQDYYEWVHFLNSFIEELTGEKQPEPDQFGGEFNRGWRERVYGKGFDVYYPDSRRKIVDEYLYPRVLFNRLVLIVEGDSEEFCVSAISEAAHWKWAVEESIKLINLNGYGGISKLEPLLEYVRQMRTDAYVILDPHEQVKTLIPKLVSSQLLKTDCYKIWKIGFEEDNFSDEEILQGCNKVMEEKGYVLSEEDLSSVGPKSKPIMARIKEALHTKYGVEFKDAISKLDLWERLLQNRLDEIGKETQDAKYAPKLEIEKVLHGAIGRFLTYHVVL